MRVVNRLCIASVAAHFVVAVAVAAAPQSAVTPTPSDAPATESNVRAVRPIERFTHLAALLNLAQGTVRVVAILPVDTRASLAAVDTVASIVKGNASKRLRAYVILRGGTEAESSLRAALLVGRASDPRIVFLWDQTSAVTDFWKPGPTPGVWLYDTSAKFAEQLPEPALVLAAAPGGDARIEGAALRNTAYELVRLVEAKMARAGADP